MQISLTTCLLAIPALVLAQNATTQSSAQDLIRKTLYSEAYFLDTKNTDALSTVYASDAVVNWTSFNDVWNGIDDIISSEVTALADHTTMHQYTNTVIEFQDDETANATSYAMWNVFGGVNEGYVQQTWAKYLDYLVLSEDGWVFQSRIVEVIAGPLKANLTT